MIMAANNNFQQLEQEDQKLTPSAPPRIERQVMGFVNTTQFAGNVLELYFTKFIQLFLMLLGVNKEDSEKAAEENQDSGEVR